MLLLENIPVVSCHMGEHQDVGFGAQQGEKGGEFTHKRPHESVACLIQPVCCGGACALVVCVSMAALGLCARVCVRMCDCVDVCAVSTPPYHAKELKTALHT